MRMLGRNLLCLMVASLSSACSGSSSHTDAGQDSATDATGDVAGDDAGDSAMPTGEFFAVDATNHLVRLTPGHLDTPDTIDITGLEADEKVLSLDVRSADGQLYALGGTSRLYVIDPATGAAAIVGSQFTTLLTGGYADIDVSPVGDRVRVGTVTQQNARVHPTLGTITIDGELAFATGDPRMGVAPYIAACAYTNNVVGATSTTLYALDPMLDLLVAVDPEDDGTLHSIGGLGVDTSSDVGFDIALVGGVELAYASLKPESASSSSLYVIDLATGAATLLGEIGGPVVHGLTYRP